MKTRLALASLLVAAACGGDDGPPNNPPTPDAPPETPTCAAATTSISSYPGTAMGTVVGAGADLTAAEMACADEQSDWYEPTGEDSVIALSGLTVGQRYGVIMSSEDDLGIYVTSSCPTTGAVEGCLVYTDAEVGGSAETAYFTATGTEHYLIVDDGEFDTLTSGNYDVQVVNAQCTVDTEMTDCQAASPYCVDFSCVQCLSSFDCQTGTPVCGTDNACIAGPAQCTGDDARDSGAGDDGPSVATMLAFPTPAMNTVVSDGKVCNTPGNLQEGDWFKVNVPANASLGIDLTFTGAGNDLDVDLLISSGSVVARGEAVGLVPESIRGDELDAGVYYVLVLQYDPENNTAAAPYTLTLSVPECDAEEFNSCTTAATPVCGGSGQCGVGPATCVGDTNGEGNDDGPAGARALITGVAQTGQTCNVAGELDYYRFTVTNGQGYTINLAWTGALNIDAYVVDSTGTLYGASLRKNPEVITLTNLPAGTYYVEVDATVPQGGMASTASTAYTITGTLDPIPDQCTTSADCASEYETQIYRSQCNPTTDVCSFLPAGDRANGMACDSDDDCMGYCSYMFFEADAGSSICVPTSCTTDAQCTAVNAGLRCTTGFSSIFGPANFCHPACDANVDCGANTGSATPDTNLPWDYYTCTVATGVCGSP